MAFTIKELSLLSGIKAHTIRIWEQRYNFLKPDRTSTNIRTYNNEELKTLLSVALLNKYGYKISHIDEMLPEQRSKAILGLKQIEAREEHLVNEMVSCMVDLRHIAFEEIINQYIEEHGIIKTIQSLVFHFLEKVGILWQTNRVNPAQEHVTSNIIRQKVISALDALPHVPTAEPLHLLFLPEDEHHELGLLFVFYLLKKNRIPVIYLGANVPLDDVSYVVRVKEPTALYLHLTAFPRQLQFERFLQQLSSKAGNAKVFISGNPVCEYHRQVPANISFLRSFSEVFSYISSI